MNRRLISAVPLLLGAGLLMSCTDQTDPAAPIAAPADFAISDGLRGGNANFFWLPPTVSMAPVPTGGFDAGALDELVIEICPIQAGGNVCTGPVIKRFTSDEASVLSEIRVYPTFQLYAAEWVTAFSPITAGRFYRVRVLRTGAELGFLDVQVVKTVSEYFSVNTSLYTGIIKGLILPLWFRIKQSGAVGAIKINEVESDGGTPGDWIELYNTSSVPVSLFGHVVSDNQGNTYTFNSTTILPGGQYVIVEEANLGWDLGSADAVKIHTPGGVLVDSFAWTSHAATTYGRCPNHTGPFQVMSVVTKGFANVCP